MPTIIDSLLVSLGFKVESKDLEGFAKKAEAAKGMLLGIVGAASAAAYGLERMVKGTAERMGGIQEFSEQMGLSAVSVAALGRVAMENGGSMEGMEGGLRQMTIMAGQAAQGVGRGAMVFKRFHIAVKDANGQVKTTEQLLGDVADKMAKLGSQPQKIALGSRLGFDPATVKLLSEGRAAFDRKREEALKANPFKASDYEAALLTKRGFKKASMAVEQLKNRLAVGLMPTVNDLLKKFTAWVKDEKNIAKVKDAVNKVVEAVSLLARNLDKVLAVLAVIYAHKYGMMIVGWGVEIMKVAGAFKTAAGTAEMLKLGFKAIQGVLTGGVLVAIGLVIEDLWTFHNGGESVTGWMVNRFPYGVEVMEGALAVLSAAFVALTLSSGPMGLITLGIGGWIIAAKNLQDNWRPVLNWFKDSLAELEDRIVLMAKIVTPAIWLLSKVMGKTDAWYGREQGPAYSPNRTGYDENDFNARMAASNNRPWGNFDREHGVKPEDDNSFYGREFASREVLSTAPSLPAGWGMMSLPNGGGMVDNSSNIAKVEINVLGSTDPRGTAKEVDRKLRETYERRDVSRVNHRNRAPGVR
jgi:hypothetical protein